jgi:sugar lactone lactonase YvrE
MNSLTSVIRAGSFALVIALLSLTAHAREWQRGDVFVAIGNGQYQVYRLMNSGKGSFYSLIETLTDGSGTMSGEKGSGGSGFTTGCAFDSTGHLYTTNFSNAKVYKFMVADPHAVSQAIPASEGALSSESIVFDGQGNFYVGHADGTHVVDKFSPTGVRLASFVVDVPEGDRGSDWIELSADGNTLYYTSEGTTIKTFNLLTNTQGPDFFSEDGGGPLFTVRLLPPSYGPTLAGDFLVANTANVLRLHVSDGGVRVAQSYTIPDSIQLFTISLDTDGTSFWVGDSGTGNLYKIDVNSGEIIFGPIATGAIPNMENTASLTGICVSGATTAAQPQPVIKTVSLSPGNNTATVFNDNNSNSWTITLNGLTTNATATIAFTEIPPSAGNSDIPGYGSCELASADGTKCVVHDVSISVDPSMYPGGIDFYHHWNFKIPGVPVNPRMIRNGFQDITTAVYLDLGTSGHTNGPSTYTDNEAPPTTGKSCGFLFPPNDIHWESGIPLPFLFRAVSSSGNCRTGPFLTTLTPTISLGKVVSGNPSVIPLALPSTLFHLAFDGRTWFYILNTRHLQSGTYIVSVFDSSNQIPAFSEQIVIVPED